jgi:P4 family phage/plasmid primase-like protien
VKNLRVRKEMPAALGARTGEFKDGRMTKPKFNKDLVREAAAGRWREIGTSVCGLTEEQMEPIHQPCPGCGGIDRYRAFGDFNETGGVFCNQCHNEKCSDGFSTVMWATRCTFSEALAKVADNLGLSPNKKKGGKKPEADPTKDLEWMPWNDTMAAFFCTAKKGVTEESLLAQGCKMARYKNLTCIVWPIIGPDLDTDKPIGYIVMDYGARRNIPKYDIHGNFIENIDKKVTFGSKSGFVGVDAIQKMKQFGMVDLIWKAEGITDLCAFWANIPENLRGKHVVLSTSCGANENPKWMGDFLSNFNVNIVHDADKGGQGGAEKWGINIAVNAAEGKQVRNVQLPYDVQEKDGKDSRDFWIEGNTWGDLLNLADKTEPIVVVRNASCENNPAGYPLQEIILKKLQAEIIGEDEEGVIFLYSEANSKYAKVEQVDRLNRERLIQIFGPPALQIISDEPDGEETFTLKDVKGAIALVAGRNRIPEKVGGDLAVLVRSTMRNNFFATDKRCLLYRYADGCYRPNGREFVLGEVKKLCDDTSLGIRWTSHKGEEVFRAILTHASLLEDEPPADSVNVLNGIVRLQDGVLLEHSPKRLSSIQLPVKYDPDARCPQIEHFVGQVFPSDALHLAWEMFGWLLAPDYSNQQAILLFGPGGDGKSTCLRLVNAFLGQHNCSSVSLHELEANRFAKSQLLGKLANVCADLPSEDLQGTSIFKEISGGDIITGEDKFKSPFQFRPFARLLFSANSLPRSRDASDGFYDRWVIVPFPNQFRDTNRCIPQARLISQITSPAELSGLLNKAIAYRQTVLASGSLTISTSVRQAHDEFRATTDPFRVWVAQHLEISPVGYVPKEELRKAYAESCAADGRSALTTTSITRHLKKTMPKVKMGQITINGKRTWCYHGIVLKDLPRHTQFIAQHSHDTPLSSIAENAEENQANSSPAQEAQLLSTSVGREGVLEEGWSERVSSSEQKKGESEKVVQSVQYPNQSQVPSFDGRGSMTL